MVSHNIAKKMLLKTHTHHTHTQNKIKKYHLSFCSIYLTMDSLQSTDLLVIAIPCLVSK